MSRCPLNRRALKNWSRNLDAEELVRSSGLPTSDLIEVGNNDRLAEPGSREAMLRAGAWAMGKMTHQQGEAFKNIRSPGAIKLDLESKLARIVWRSADTFSRCFNCHNDESVGLDY